MNFEKEDVAPRYVDLTLGKTGDIRFELGATFETSVAGGEIGLELREARVDAVELLVRQRDLAASPARAGGVRQTEHVRRAADEAEVVFDAAAEPHPTVARRFHDDYLVVGGRITGSREPFPLTVIAGAGRYGDHTHTHMHTPCHHLS